VTAILVPIITALYARRFGEPQSAAGTEKAVEADSLHH